MEVVSTPYPFPIPKGKSLNNGLADPNFIRTTMVKIPCLFFGPRVKKHSFGSRLGRKIHQFNITPPEKEYPNLLEEYTITGFNAVAHRGAQGKRTMMPEVAACIRDLAKKLVP